MNKEINLRTSKPCHITQNSAIYFSCRPWHPFMQECNWNQYLSEGRTGGADSRDANLFILWSSFSVQ